MEGRRIACCFIVRNGEDYIDRNIRELEAALSGVADEIRYFYVENDSTDHTRDTLDKFAMEMPGRWQGEQLNISRYTSIEMCKGKSSYNCASRTRFLASLRQRVLDRALSWEDCTTVIMLDLDVVRFEHSGLRRLLSLLDEKNADGAFGMSVADGCIGDHKCFYDIGALDASASALVHIANGRVARVASAFSGFGVYSAAALRHLNVTYDTQCDGIEHHAFNRQLRRLYVDGSFRPVYHGRGQRLTWHNTAWLIAVSALTFAFVVAMAAAALRRTVKMSKLRGLTVS